MSFYKYFIEKGSVMSNSKLDINKTKYRYFKDNFEIFPVRTTIKYCIPVPKEKETADTEFFDRDYPDVSISTVKFVKMIDATAKALVALGVHKGDVVTICQTNTPEIFYMDYALSKIGAIPNYIYPNVTAEEMKYYIDELDSKYIFILDDEPIRKIVKEALQGTDIKIISASVIESFPTAFKIIASKKIDKTKTPLNNEINWSDFIKNGKKITDVKEVEYKPNSTCSYVHTSGTSSIPKAIIETNENVNSIAKGYYIDDFPSIKGKLALQTIPQFVEYGKTTNHIYFTNNFCLVIIPEMNPKNYYDLVKKYKPTFTYTTPSHIRELIKRPLDMSNFVYGAIGGDGFDDVETSFIQYMINNNGTNCILQGYGASEASAVVANNTPNHYKQGSLGRLAGEVEGVIIEPGTFNVLTKPNEIGELCVTGPSITMGYAGNSKEETGKVFIKHPDGKVYVHMGDYISIDEDGFLFYHGRIKNVISRRSFKFAPKEIEDIILSHKNVEQCIVVGKYNEAEGQVPSAHIVLKDSCNESQVIDEIIELVNANIQEFHRPTVYKIKPYIIITRNNKININALKIEDIATIPKEINDAQISQSTDNNYDYDLKLFVETDAIDKDSIISFIETIAKNEKVLNGSIKYEFVKELSNNYIRQV
jgi:long-chain acyl-CoA synthetase